MLMQTYRVHCSSALHRSGVPIRCSGDATTSNKPWRGYLCVDLLRGSRLGVDGPGGDAHDLPGGGDVGAVRAEDLVGRVLSLDGLDPVLGGRHAPHLPHAVHLVADDLAPVGAVLVGLDDGRDLVVLTVTPCTTRAQPRGNASMLPGTDVMARRLK